MENETVCGGRETKEPDPVRGAAGGAQGGVPSSRRPERGKLLEKSGKFPQKSVDPEISLCYTLFYLSDERFLFARFLSRAGGSPASKQGGNAHVVSK